MSRWPFSIKYPLHFFNIISLIFIITIILLLLLFDCDG